MMVKFNIDCANCGNREVCKYLDNMDNIQNDINMLINSITLESDNLQLTLSCKYHRTDVTIRTFNDSIDNSETCRSDQAHTSIKYHNQPSSYCNVSESGIAKGECSVAPPERTYATDTIERSSDKISAGDFLTNIINTCKETR